MHLEVQKTQSDLDAGVKCVHMDAFSRRLHDHLGGCLFKRYPPSKPLSYPVGSECEVSVIVEEGHVVWRSEVRYKAVDEKVRKRSNLQNPTVTG